MKADGLCRKYGISDATYYDWKTRLGGMTMSEARRPKVLEAENNKLKRSAVTHLMTANQLGVTRL